MFELNAIDLATACGGIVADRWTDFQSRIDQELADAWSRLGDTPRTLRPTFQPTVPVPQPTTDKYTHCFDPHPQPQTVR